MPSAEGLRNLVKQSKDSVVALAALGAALDEQAGNVRLPPPIKAEIDSVLAALGGREVLVSLEPAELKTMLADIRASLLQAAKLVLPAGSPSGWTHTEAEILQSQGEASAAFPLLLKASLAARLEGLEARLGSPDAFFLDVGVGVGALSSAMAGLWPSLRVVGIDIWRPALALAHENLVRAGLSSRIELREQAVQDLEDLDRFDLAWFPGVFIDSTVIEAGLRNVHRALRPGGWLLFGLSNPGSDALAQSVARLKTVLWGGTPRTPGEVEALLRSVNCVDVQALASPPWAYGTMVAGRKPL